ncbi:hypothetical protein [Micromonospora sp. NPDC048898]
MIAVVETAKAVVDVEAGRDGVLVRTLVELGSRRPGGCVDRATASLLV